MEIAKLHAFDVEQLACAVTGIDYDEIDADLSRIEDALMENFEISFDGFYDIVCRLTPLIEMQKSQLTGKLLKGFADKENGLWLTKMEVI